MKAIFAMFTVLFSTAYSTRISLDHIGTLFRKALTDTLNSSESVVMRDAIEIIQRPERVTFRAIDTSTTLRGKVDCILCRTAVNYVIEKLRKDESQEVVLQKLSYYCKVLGYGDDAVCKGFITLNLPIFGRIVRTNPKVNAETICGLSLQKTEDPTICPYHDERFDWKVTLPPRNDEEAELYIKFRKRARLPGDMARARKGKLKVAILADPHIDPQYKPNSVADCDKQLCCRDFDEKHFRLKDIFKLIWRSNDEDSVLTKSLVQDDGHITLDLSAASQIRAIKSQARRFWAQDSAPAGYWGDYRNCDTPIWAYDDIVENIAKTHPDIDYLYYIGDAIDHGVWQTNEELNNKVQTYSLNKLRRSLGDKVVILPTIGNHDIHPANVFAPVSLRCNRTAAFYKNMEKKWSRYLSKEASKTFKQFGGYSMQILPGLRVISINNNVAFRANWWQVFDPKEAKRHLDFLTWELWKAERAGDKVHLLAHIPAGYSDLPYSWTREYNRIVRRFSKTIAAEFNGHVHTDEFRIYYDAANEPVSIAWGGGSATTYSNYNLNYKIVQFDPDDYVPTNIITYSYNLTEANLNPKKSPKWSKLYDMRKTFEVDDLTPVSIHNLLVDMVTNRRDLLELYNRIHSKNNVAKYKMCDTECALRKLCENVVTVLWERHMCDNLTMLYNMWNKDNGLTTQKSAKTQN